MGKELPKHQPFTSILINLINNLLQQVRYYIITFLVLITITNAFSQNNPEDFNLWSGVSFEKKLMKKVEGEVSLENRLDENATQLSKNLIQLGIKYKGLKKIDLYTNYRYTERPDRSSNRFDFRASWDEKIIKRTEVKLMVKSQFDKDSDQKYWDSMLRFKWEIEHKIKKKDIYPYFSNEWFYDLSGEGNKFDGLRLSIGVGIDTFKDQSLDIGYTRDIEINTSYPENRNILGIAYKFDL